MVRVKVVSVALTCIKRPFFFWTLPENLESTVSYCFCSGGIGGGRGGGGVKGQAGEVWEYSYKAMLFEISWDGAHWTEQNFNCFYRTHSVSWSSLLCFEPHELKCGLVED